MANDKKTGTKNHEIQFASQRYSAVKGVRSQSPVGLPDYRERPKVLASRRAPRDDGAFLGQHSLAQNTELGKRLSLP